MAPRTARTKAAPTFEASQRLMSELVNVMQAEEGQTEDEEEDVIHKELVTWAGRLEMESIDLRDKSKSLTSELMKNSDLMKANAVSLKKDLEAWRKEIKIDTKIYLEKLDKAHSLLLKTVATIESFSKAREKNLRAQPLLDPKAGSILETIAKQVSTLSEYQLQRNRQHATQTDEIAQKILKIVEKKNQAKPVTALEEPVQIAIKELNGNFRDCMIKLIEISKNQNVMAKDLYEMRRDQKTLQKACELTGKSSGFNHLQLHPTPQNSLNQSSRPSTKITGGNSLAVRPTKSVYTRSKRKAELLKTTGHVSNRSVKHPRKLLHDCSPGPQNNTLIGETTLVSLLSDDLRSDP